MSYKKYVIIILMFSIGLPILVWSLLTVIPEERYMDGEYSSHMYQRDYIHADGNKEELLFLGDSRMQCGVIPSIVREDAVNLALGGATPLIMYHSLEVYLKHHPAPKCVVVGFSPGHYEELDQFYRRIGYFHYLSEDELRPLLENISKFNNLNAREEFNLYVSSWKYTVRSPFVYLPALFKSRLGRKDINRKNYEEQVASKGHIVFGTAETSNKASMIERDFKPMPVMDFYIREIINLCKRKNIKVSVIQLPINPANYDLNYINGKYLKTYESYLKKLKKELVCDIETQMVVYPADCFGDPSHLNPKGQERFSRELVNKLNLR